MIRSIADLRSAIREVAEHEPDPARVTHKLLQSMTPDDAQVVVSLVLHRYVRESMAEVVRLSCGSNPSMAERPGAEYQTRDGRKTVSAQVAAQRDWVAATLAGSVNVAPNSGRDWKFLGDCTREECLILAGNRHRKASEVEAEGKRYDLIAEAMTEYQADAIRELPREVLEELLKR